MAASYTDEDVGLTNAPAQGYTDEEVGLGAEPAAAAGPEPPAGKPWWKKALGWEEELGIPTPGKVMGQAGKMITGALADVGTLPQHEAGEPLLPNVTAAAEGKPLPVMQLMDNPAVSKAISVPYKAATGLLETVPQVTAVTAATALGVPAPLAAAGIYGQTEEGFSPEQAGVAAALPFIGKYSGEIIGALAKRLGVSATQAVNLLKGLGGITGAAGYLGLIDESKIEQLPPEKRDEARIQALANILGQSLLGPMGVEKEPPKPEFQGPPATGAVLNTPKGAPGPAGKKVAQPVEVPGTPAEPRTTVIGELRSAGANTTKKVQQYFKSRGFDLSNEQARDYRVQAFPETRAKPEPQPTTPTQGGENAGGEQKAAAIHGNVQPQPGQGEGKMPPAESGRGVQPSGAEAGKAQSEVALKPEAPPLFKGAGAVEPIPTPTIEQLTTTSAKGTPNPRPSLNVKYYEDLGDRVNDPNTWVEWLRSLSKNGKTIYGQDSAYQLGLFLRQLAKRKPAR